MQTQVVRELQDLTYLSWDRVRNSSSTAGSFLKAYSDLGGKKVYYKLSNYDSVNGVVGHECVNEIIVDRLLAILGIEHLHYQLIHARIRIGDIEMETWLCASEDFKERGESKIALETYYQQNRLAGESQMQFCTRYGWEKTIYEMLVTDFLILNRDRHGANIEVLRNNRRKTLRLAPLFDHGLSLLFNCHDEAALAKADVMEDKPVQCFVGSHSAQNNLELIPAAKMPQLQPLCEEHRQLIFADLEDALPGSWQDKIWRMLWERWCYYENFSNQRG